MTENAERRRAIRLDVPEPLHGSHFASRPARLLDLSAEGARIEHPHPVRERGVCFLDFPPALGRLRLTGRVVWTKLHTSERLPTGAEHTSYQSGLAFLGMTPEQRTALLAALEILKTENLEAEGGRQ